ncbi:uncharacterized protein N7515_007131 [Penicillium bovifimosum]|uniref:EthD domain-containing protein n=1 Tax=Penicillium bovifimosum TaxID=126998 RepID=A0A9W9GW13_9EURO|nr:uncharacterized protein N7515_007131 [Penicillium bovifimosum]KAJ5131092.1 hypothetical protein N7515_007131 [Penicillium bovifimosum]
MTTPQNLLKRRPGTTREEFSKYWETKHALIVLPWALKYGITYYAQIHDMSLQSPIDDMSLNLQEWDGASEMISTASEEDKAAWRANDPCYLGYYQHVIVPDEERFLIDKAASHVKTIKPGTVTGRKVVIIEDGKALVDAGEEIMTLWNQWMDGDSR